MLFCQIHLLDLVVFLVEPLWFSEYTILSSVTNDSFTSYFSIWIHFISSCLIALARTSSTMLNKHGESGHSCLGPNLKGNAFSFCPLSMRLAVGFSYMAFIILRYVLSIPTGYFLS